MADGPDGSLGALLCLALIAGLILAGWVSRRNRQLRKHRWKNDR